MRGRSIFAPDRLERAAQPTSRQELLRDAGSLQIVHSLGGGQRPRASGAMSLFIETLGARQGRRECGLRLFLGASDRGRRRLAIELCPNRLRRHRSGVRVSRGLAHRLLELRDPAAAWTGMRRRDAEAKGGGNEQGCRSRLMARRRICEHLHDVFNRMLPRFSARRRPDVRQDQLRRPDVARRPAGCATTLLLKKLGRHDPPAPRTVS